MLPVVLPSFSTSPPPTAAANQPLLVQATSDASAAMRQFLPSAVIATAAPGAYFPGTMPWRQVQGSDRATAPPNTPVTPQPYTDDYNTPPPAPIQYPRPSVPFTLGIPFTTQLTAQFIAQQPATAVSENADPSPSMPEEPAPPPKSKDVPFARAKGAHAYIAAASRNAAILRKPEIEAA